MSLIQNNYNKFLVLICRLVITPFLTEDDYQRSPGFALCLGTGLGHVCPEERKVFLHGELFYILVLILRVELSKDEPYLSLGVLVNQVIIGAMPIAKSDGDFFGRCPTLIVFFYSQMGCSTCSAPYLPPVAPQELQAMTV